MPSGTWTTCDTNLAGGHHQELAEPEIVSVVLEHDIEVINLGLQLPSCGSKMASGVELSGLFTELGRLGEFLASTEPGRQFTRHEHFLRGARDSHIEQPGKLITLSVAADVGQVDKSYLIGYYSGICGQS